MRKLRYTELIFLAAQSYCQNQEATLGSLVHTQDPNAHTPFLNENSIQDGQAQIFHSFIFLQPQSLFNIKNQPRVGQHFTPSVAPP